MRRDGRRNYVVSFQHISDALIASGYTKLDEQARALGIHRATAWTIVKTKHKLGRLHAKTTRRILQIPTPHRRFGLLSLNIWPNGQTLLHKPKKGQKVHRPNY